jgi:hypothetical protein
LACLERRIATLEEGITRACVENMVWEALAEWHDPSLGQHLSPFQPSEVGEGFCITATVEPEGADVLRGYRGYGPTRDRAAEDLAIKLNLLPVDVTEVKKHP